MAVSRSCKEVFDYILEAERGLPPTERTTFVLRRLSSATMLAIQNLPQFDAATQVVSLRTGDQRLLALRAGLAGWSNLVDENGDQVKFVAEQGRRMVLGVAIDNPAATESLDLLQAGIVHELADAIMAGNTLTKADAKN